MEPESSLPHSQVSATCPYPESNRSNPCPISHFLKIHLNIILPFKTGSSKRSFSLRFPHQNPRHVACMGVHATCRTYLVLRDLIIQTIFAEEYRSWSSSLGSFLHSLVTLSLSVPNILLSTLFSNILSLGSSLKMCDQVTHPYKKTVTIIVLYIF